MSFSSTGEGSACEARNCFKYGRSVGQEFSFILGFLLEVGRIVVGVGRGASSEGKLLQVEEVAGSQAYSFCSSSLLNPLTLAMVYHCFLFLVGSLEMTFPNAVKKALGFYTYQV